MNVQDNIMTLTLNLIWITFAVSVVYLYSDPMFAAWLLLFPLSIFIMIIYYLFLNKKMKDDYSE